MNSLCRFCSQSFLLPFDRLFLIFEGGISTAFARLYKQSTNESIQIDLKMPVYKFYYLSAKGLGEPIRLLFHYKNQEFEDCRVGSLEDVANRKDEFPFGKVISVNSC